MGKKKPNTKKGGNRFFRWIKSDLPDVEDEKPVLLLGVNRITESPFFKRRPLEGATTSGSIRFFRPPKSKYTRKQGDERLEKIKKDLLTHKHESDIYIPNERTGGTKNCDIEKIKDTIKLNCASNCVCRRKSSNRGSFTFHPRSDYRQSSLCPSEPYGIDNNRIDSDNDIEYKYSYPIQNIPDVQPSCSKQSSYNVTPTSAERRSLLLANINERLRKTLSLDSRKVESNRLPLSLPKESRPRSLINTSNIIIQPIRPIEPFVAENFTKATQPKKKRKSFFLLEAFFDKKSDSSSIDDYCSSKYKRFELESDDSPLFRRNLTREKTPDLLNLPVIIDSVRKRQSDTKRQLEKLECHYYKGLNNGSVSRTVIDAVPKDAQDINGAEGNINNVYEDSDVEYIEPIRSNFTSQSTLILDKNGTDFNKPNSILNINTDETDIKLPSSTVSPKSNEVRVNDFDSIGAYEIEVKEADLLTGQANKLIVKIMDKSVDSIGSCSLDVDASTDFSDTTSGSLNLLTPSSTASKVRDFNRAFQERTSNIHSLQPRLSSVTPTPAATPARTPENVTPTPQHRNILEHSRNGQSNHSEHSRRIDINGEAAVSNGNLTDLIAAETSVNSKALGFTTNSDNLLKPPPKVVVNDSSSNRSRTHHKKRDEIPYKKPSYLNLACSVNGYTNLTTYDSKLRQDINKSRKASPIRPISSYNYKTEAVSLVVPVPVGANKLLVPNFKPNAINLTDKAPFRALTDINIAPPIHVFMAEENKQLKKDFLGNMTSTSRPYMSSESKTFASSMLNPDETDNSKEITFKSSYSESNFRKTVSTNGSLTEHRISSESYTISNGVKRGDIAKENGEILTSPMKSFIQQRVERLYGPGALAQGFFAHKRYKQKSQSDENDYKILSEKSLNCSAEILLSRKSTENEFSSPTKDDQNISLPVLRHLRPEFRAQLPILSPKRSPSVSPQKQENDIPNSKTDSNLIKNGDDIVVGKEKAASVFSDVTNGVSGLKINDLSDVPVEKNCVLAKSSVKSVNGSVNGGAENNGCAEVVRDGHYFLDLKKKETERLLLLAASAERELENLQGTNVSEEVQGLLRSAAGKAKLLATQKMQQFEGLCWNNINDSGAPSAFPTTLQDLQGFWDMVLLQVDNVDATHRHIAELKKNQWREIREPTPPKASPAGPSVSKPRRSATPGTEKAKLAAEKREQERKTMLEHRRRVAREMQLAARTATPGTSREHQTDMGIEGGQEVEIFVGKAPKTSKVAPKGDCKSAAPSDDSMFDES